MKIANVITERVKDVFTLSVSIAKVVKEEVELYMANQEEDDYDYEDDDEDEDYTSRHEAVKNAISAQFEQFETKAKEVVKGAFSKFKITQSEEQAELEKRIAKLEKKLSKLVEDSLEALRKDEAGRI